MEREIGKEFIEKTKYKYLMDSGQMRGIPHPPLELTFDSKKTRIKLPDLNNLSVSSSSLLYLIEKRRSLRNYADQPISLAELSYLLWCTQGVLRIMGSATLRTVPSAGARHALETYLLINNVDDLPQGIYRYLALEHQLIEVAHREDIADEIADGCLGQSFVKTSGVTFIWVAIKERMTWRYGQRGYRYLFLDAGHVCQNLYLSAQTIGCGVCGIAAFSDDDLNSILKLDGVEKFVIYLASVGKIS